MLLYKLFVRPMLFLLPSEVAHDLTLSLLEFASRHPFLLSLLRWKFAYEDPRLETNILGLCFKNPFGLAAGMDKNARALPAWGALGFGFVEIGTITPRKQTGNDKPRMFRIRKDRGIINRLGFNNDGSLAVANRLETLGKLPIIVGISVGKQKETPLEYTATDHDICLERLFRYGDYFVLNISSPNTLGLRKLQGKNFILELLQRARSKMDELNAIYRTRKSIFVKIAPDLNRDELETILDAVAEARIDGVIATNTTLSREGLQSDETLTKEKGGASGPALQKRSREIVRKVSSYLPATVIIGVGGIECGPSAHNMMRAGANLIEVYTGLVYEGPGLIKKVLRYVAERSIHF